jgi:hypothetical protein
MYLKVSQLDCAVFRKLQLQNIEDHHSISLRDRFGLAYGQFIY